MAFESGLIQASGEKRFRRTDKFIKSRITQKQGNAEEGLNPVEHIEYHFNGTDDDYTQIQSAAPNTSENLNLPDGTDGGPCETSPASITINNVNNLMCDPPTATLNAGYNQYTGLQFVRAVETPAECAFNLMRMKHLQRYVKGVRKSFPREMDVAYCRKLEELSIAYGRTNSVETCGNLLLGNGSFPAIPTGTADFGTYLQHAEALRGNGWTGPVIYGIGHSSLMNMMRNHKLQSGLELKSSPFTVDDMALNSVPGDLVVIGDVGFKILETPTRGYMEKIGTSSARFVRVDPRKLQPGSGAGITAEYDANYQNAWINIDGQEHPMVELSPFIHPMAASVRPFALKQIPSVPIDGRFNMEVKVIRGAFIECNKDDSKFAFRARHFFKFVPEDPRLMGMIAHRYAPYQRYHHTVPECEIAVETIDVTGPTLCPPLDNACCDVVNGSDPTSARPVTPTASDPAPTNGAGEIITQCEVLVTPGETTVRMCAERRGGSSGAASIQADTSNDTALAGTNYTAVVAEVLSWADGEFGIKCFDIAIIIVPADTVDKQFFVDWTSVTGASAASDMCTQSTVIIQPTP